MIKAHGIVQDLDFDDFFEADDSIRFIGICNTQGQLLDAQYRKTVTPLSSPTNLQYSAVKIAIRATTREGDIDVGKPIYTVTLYENIKRATVPLGHDLLLFLSFERNQDESKIMKKVLNVINNKWMIGKTN